MKRLKIVALAGGSGSAKLLRGLRDLSVDLTVVGNVGDNVWMYGAYVCPDLDIASYSLAGVVDKGRGWGIRGDTFNALKLFEELGLDTWFSLGDQDLAFCLARTELLRRGSTLTEATDAIRRALGVGPSVLPATNRHMETRIATRKGDMHLQEFWVRDGGRPGVLGVSYKGAGSARPTDQVKSAIVAADRVVVCPGNPVTSIGPILAIPGFVRLLKESRGKVVSISPMSGRAPFSGPAGKFMKAMGQRPDSAGVAEMYSAFLDGLLISEDDKGLIEEIEALGVRCRASDTRMRGSKDERRLAKELLEL